MLVLNFLYVWNFLSLKLKTSFSTLSIFIVSGKKSKPFWEGHVIDQDIQHQLQENILYLYFYGTIL